MVGLSRIWKLYLVYTVVLVGGMTLAGLVLDNRLTKKLLEHLQEDVITLARVLGKGMPDTEDQAALLRFCKSYKEIAKVRITVIGKDGKVLADSDEEKDLGESRLDRPEVEAAMRRQTGYAARYSTTLRMNMLYGAAFMEDKGKVLRVAMPMSKAKVFHNEIMFLFSLALFLAPVFAMIVSFIVAKYKIRRGDWQSTGAWHTH